MDGLQLKRINNSFLRRIQFEGIKTFQCSTIILLKLNGNLRFFPPILNKTWKRGPFATKVAPIKTFKTFLKSLIIRSEPDLPVSSRRPFLVPQIIILFQWGRAALSSRVIANVKPFPKYFITTVEISNIPEQPPPLFIVQSWTHRTAVTVVPSDLLWLYAWFILAPFPS